MLAAIERGYRLKVMPEKTPAERADDVKKVVMERVARTMGISVPSGSFAEGLHTLQRGLRLHRRVARMPAPTTSACSAGGLWQPSRSTRISGVSRTCSP